MLHSDPPDQFFGSEGADAGREPLDAPGDGRIAARAALCLGVFLWRILGVFVGTRRLLEPRPRMGVHPVVARQFGRQRILDRLPPADRSELIRLVLAYMELSDG